MIIIGVIMITSIHYLLYLSRPTVQSNRYPFIWRLLHWLSAIIILWAIFSGFFILLAHPDKDVIHKIANFNVAITLLFIPVFIVRIFVVYYFSKPTTDTLARHQQTLANLAHAFIYLVLSVVLISGVLMMENTMSVFGWFEISAILDKGASTQFFFILHRAANTLLTLLLFVHIAAVIKHQLNGVPILRKMI
jgi:cytochrome b561